MRSDGGTGVSPPPRTDAGASATGGRGFKAPAVGLVYFGTMAVLVVGLLRSPYAYADVRFVVDYFGTELQAAAVLLVCTVLFFNPAAIGLRRPQWDNGELLIPAALLLGLNAAIWAYSRWVSVPTADSATVSAFEILRTTLLVGVTEEWTYRGVMLAALSAWLGLRRGALLSLLLFGLLHVLNLAGGQSPLMVAVQVLMAALTGAVLLLAALATRSLLVPILVHGLYDFLVIDRTRLVPDEVASALTLVALVAGPLLGLYSVRRLWRLPEGAPYPDRA